jgi:glycosyltransferase involved in cell wall biosynthesis
MMKTIGILCFPDRRQGGILQYTQTMIDALLLDKTNKYVIITSKQNHDYDYHDAEVIRTDINMESIATKLHILVASLFRMKYVIGKDEKKLFSAVDLIVSPFISLYPHCWLDIPYVITIHDLQERYFPDYFTLSQRVYRRVTRYLAAKGSRRVICESDYVRNDIVKYLKLPASRIDVIESPPPLMRSNGVRGQEYLQKVKAKYSLPEKYLIYPAQFWPHKNHVKLLDAFEVVTRKYDDIHLVLTGGSLSAQPEMLKRNGGTDIVQHIKRLGLTQKVHCLGYVDYGCLPGIYVLSQMLVVPTLFESISLPIYEAFRLRVPVCASNVVALPEQVGNGGLLFDPHDHKDIAAKIIEMIEDRALREKCVENGLRKVERMNMGNYSRTLVEVINGLQQS